MKKIVFNNKLGLITMLMAIVSMFTQCERKYEMDLSLSVNSNEIHLEAQEGKSKIMVYADAAWQVSIKEDADWFALDRTAGHGNGDLLFSFSQNFGVSRSITLLITKGKETQEIKIIQKGLDAAFRFSKSKYTITKDAFKINLPIINELKSNVKKVKVEYLYDDETSEQWVTDLQMTEAGVEFQALANNAGRNRTVRIYLSVIDGFDKEYVVYTDVDQSLLGPTLVQRKEESLLTRSAKLDTVIVKGNVGALFPDFEKHVQYEQGDGWIEQVDLLNDSLMVIAVRTNSSGAERVANVQLKYTNNGITYIDLTHKVIQSADDFTYVTLEELKGLIPTATGEVRLQTPLKVLEAFVISDAGNTNMELNPNTSFNTIDYTASLKTAYVQNAVGSSGIRLKFATSAANSLKRYSKVALNVDGLMLVKEANPTRYTIQGLTASTIVKSDPGTVANLPVKSKYTSELNDNDVYTFVTLKNTAISVPYGSYVNVNMGYVGIFNWNTAGASTPYVDAVPTSLYDEQGGNIKAIVNTAASWSRSTLPTGTGSFAGILVHHKLLKYGFGEGEIGRYSIRPVNQADIKLQNPQKAKTLVEWRWMNLSNLSAAGTFSQVNGSINPAVGQGEMRPTVTGSVPSMGAHPIFHTEASSKVVPSSALQYSSKWWNAGTQEGEGIVFKFATTGVSAKALLLHFSQGGGSGTISTLHIPTYWQVAYSLDGTNYTVLPQSTYGIRPLAGWGLNHEFTANGLNSFSFKLPNDLLNKPNVYVKLQAKNDICAVNSPKGAETGRITASSPVITVRLGVVSFNYIP